MTEEQLDRIIIALDKILNANSELRSPVKYVIVKNDKSVMFFSHKPVVNKNNDWDIAKFSHCFWEIIEFDNEYCHTDFADNTFGPSDFIGLPIDIPLEIDLLRKGLLKIKKQSKEKKQND